MDPCYPKEPICKDGRNENTPFYYSYTIVFSELGVRLPLDPFEKELLSTINIAPAQLHPNSWAFVRAFHILCTHLGIVPSTNMFFYFFESKTSGCSSWTFISTFNNRVLVTEYQSSYKHFKRKLLKICSSPNRPNILEGFHLYWLGSPYPSRVARVKI